MQLASCFEYTSEKKHNIIPCCLKCFAINKIFINYYSYITITIRYNPIKSLRLSRMEVIFDVFFDETFRRMERSGLKTRQNRKDVIDHLNAVISGGCQGMYYIRNDNENVYFSMIIATIYPVITGKGHNLTPEEGSRLAVLAVIRYHRRYKDSNSTVKNVYIWCKYCFA